MPMYRVRAFALGLTLAALLATSAAKSEQTESPVACGGGFIALVYGDHTTGCSLPLGGSQGFTFDGVAGDRVRLNGITHTNGLDLLVRSFDPTFTELPSTGCNAAFNVTCSFSHEFILDATGTYTLSVSDNGNDGGGSYTLQLETVPVSPHGMDLPYDLPMSDTISPQGDLDFFAFWGTAGTDVRLNLLSTTNGLDPQIEVYDPNGDLLDTSGCAAAFNVTCSFQLDLVDLALTGSYSVVSSDTGVNNSGNYQLSLWCTFGDCEDAPGAPDPDATELSFVTDATGTVSPQTDAVVYEFNGTAGTTTRLNVRSATNGFDPRIEIRSPSGTIVVDGSGDGAGCSAAFNATCSSSIDIPLTESGTHTLIVSDAGVNNGGSYNLGLHCLQGPCDSDADGLTDEYVSVLTHGDLFDLSISPPTDADFLRFKGTPGTLVEISIVGRTNGLDPYFQLWDPSGTQVANGAGDGAGCAAAFNTTCSAVYALPLPVMEGDYKLAVYDGGVDNGGSYRIAVHCIAGSCSDAMPTLVADNCIEVPNGPAAPGPGGHVQRDSDSDGFGDVCDADYDGDDVVGGADFALFSAAFNGSDPVYDHNADGVVAGADFAAFSQLFSRQPGPSGLGCGAATGLCPLQQ